MVSIRYFRIRTQDVLQRKNIRFKSNWIHYKKRFCKYWWRMLETKYVGDKLLASEKISLRRYFVTNVFCFLKPFYDHGDSLWSMTSWCCWLEVGNNFRILVWEFRSWLHRLHRCWWRMLETKRVGDNFKILVTVLAILVTNIFHL